MFQAGLKGVTVGKTVDIDAERLLDFVRSAFSDRDIEAKVREETASTQA
jgi:hypothetical protein